MIHTRFFIIILIILGGIASCQDQPDNLSIKENHANIKSRSLAISKDEAIDLVKQKVLSKDTSDINVFISNTIIEENDTIQRYLSGNSIIKSSCWFFFVDDNPMENWSHPCRYIYVTMNGEFSIEQMFLFEKGRIFCEKRGVFSEKGVKKLLQFCYRTLILVTASGAKWGRNP